MTGEFDVGEADAYSSNTKNVKTVSYWKEMNGANSVGIVKKEDLIMAK